MDSQWSRELQRSVDTLTERSLNSARTYEQLQKQTELLSKKLDVILSQLSQNSIENVESHLNLKVSFKNKINESFKTLNNVIDELNEAHTEDIKCLKSNVMVRLGNSHKFMTVLFFVILFAFWQNVDNVLNKLANEYGIKVGKKQPAVREESVDYNKVLNTNNEE